MCCADPASTQLIDSLKCCLSRKTLTQKHSGGSLNENWSGCDNTWFLQDDVINMLELHAVDGINWTEDQEAFLSNLDSKVTVYRGCSRDRIFGLSWTTDRRVAEEFARGHRGIRVDDPVVVKTKIRKDIILAVFLDRDESEIILNPDFIRQLYIEPR